MVSTRRSAIKSEEAEQVDQQQNDTVSTMPPTKSYNIPQRPSSRAPSAARDDVPSSGSTIFGEDTNMHSEDYGETVLDPMQSFGQRSRKLIDVIRKLEELGIDVGSLTLPRFVVVGDQSHGKSSVIEANCEISLPRNFGTCTRCPVKITTTASTPQTDSWSAEVTLSRRYVPVSYGKWQDTSASADHFATVTEKSDLGRVLRLAQIAILNPELDPARLLATNGTPTNQALEFSYNAINVKISGPDLPELSFIDLPGCIQSVREGLDQSLPKMVEELVKTHIQDEKTLILLVATANSDFENSTAISLVRNCKAMDRCMGVLTKPDQLETCRQSDIRNLLNNKSFKVGHSWYVTKNLAQEQLDGGVTHAEARQLETTFFRQEDMWSSRLTEHQGRFGTNSVRNAISSLLVNHIEREIPEIIAGVRERLEIVASRLDSMPEVPDRPTVVVMREAQKVAKMVEARINDDEEEGNLRSKVYGMVCEFQKQLGNARPYPILATPGYEKPVLPIDDENDDEVPSTPSAKKRKADDGTSRPQSTAPTPRRARREQDSPPTSHRLVLTLDMFKRARERASNVRDQCNPKVVERFFREAVGSWKALTASLMNRVNEEVGMMLGNCIADAIGSRGETLMLERTRAIVQSLCVDAYIEQAANIERLLAFDLRGPLTYNDKMLNQQNKDLESQARQRRNVQRTDEHYDPMAAQGMKVPVGDKRKEKASDSAFVNQTLGFDEYAVDVTAMVSVMAYYNLVSARLVDNVAVHLQQGFLHRVKSKLEDKLLDELQVDDSKYCAQLLAQDPMLEEQRVVLLEQREKLEKGMEILNGLKGRY